MIYSVGGNSELVYTIGTDQTKTNEALIVPEDSAVLRAKPTATQYNSVIGVVAKR